MGSKWSSELFTGFNDIDEHHFTIIKKLFEVEQLINKSPSKSEIMDTLLFLESYTQMHFKHEEMVMADEHCPAAEENKRQHEVFIKKVRAFNQNFAYDETMDVDLKDVAKELSDWFINHIKEVDLQLKIN